MSDKKICAGSFGHSTKFMPSNERNQKSKYWCFTLNNYTTAETSKLEATVPLPLFTYIIFGREVCPTTGTPHLQGYVEFGKRVRRRAIARIPGFERARVDRRKGTGIQASDYCRKDGRVYEWGSLETRTQGTRSDLDEIKTEIDSGANALQVAENHFSSWCRYRQSFAEYRRLRTPVGARQLEVYVLWGAPGTGKTRLIFETFPDVWIACDPSLNWFDGYAGQPVVLLDDYRGDASAAFLLRLLDVYPMLCPVKGSFTPWVPTKVFITSNMAPPFGHYDIQAALNRRIKHVIKMDANIYRDGAEGEIEYLRTQII